MRHLEIGTKVTVVKDVEVSPLHYIKRGYYGEVVDKTFPYYYLIKFNFGEYWIGEEYLREDGNQRWSGLEN